MKTETALAAEKAENTVEPVDFVGRNIGVTVRIKRSVDSVEPEEGKEPARARLRTIAKGIAGWSSMEHEGKPYPFSQERAVALFQRHPHFADQVEGAVKKGSR